MKNEDHGLCPAGGMFRRDSTPESWLRTLSAPLYSHLGSEGVYAPLSLRSKHQGLGNEPWPDTLSKRQGSAYTSRV